MSVDIIVCDTPKRQAELFGFRHRIWSGEIGASVPGDRQTQMFDDADTLAINYAAVEHDRIIASLRVRDLRQLGDITGLAKRYHLHGLIEAVGVDALAHVGRLAVDRGHRGGICLMRLMERALRDSVERGIRAFCFDCSPYLLRMYEALGAVRTGVAFSDPMLGFKLPMAMVIGDIPYLREIGSPYLRVLQDLPTDEAGRAWRLALGGSRPLQAIVDPEAFLAIVEQRLQVDAAGEQNLFSGLSREQRAQVLTRSVTFLAERGQEVIKPGLREDALFVVLSGLVEVVREDNPDFVLATLGSGEFFGEMAYLTQDLRRNRVIAREPSEILLVSADVLRSLRQKEPAIYAEVMHNIARRLADRLVIMSLNWYGAAAG